MHVPALRLRLAQLLLRLLLALHLRSKRSSLRLAFVAGRELLELGAERRHRLAHLLDLRLLGVGRSLHLESPPAAAFAQ
jgi:hypothetical protein